MFFKPVYILILVFTIVIDYFAGIWIGRAKNKRAKKYLLASSIVANVGVLAMFKYYNFIAVNINDLTAAWHVGKELPLLSILLPIGLSFHTFQAMSYTIEVYRGNQAPEKHFGIYALYVMFYPQLVAGPIERPQNVLHQFHEVKRFDYDNMKRGLILIAWGLFKKVVIADRLALFVNQVYGNPYHYHGIPLMIATCFFALQIYCDFSGYSDIALGTARCMGYELMVNFKKPYMATSIGEFWQRWHISLSTWFRDYLYIPLGGNRVSKLKWYRNIMIVFVLSGVWHGANWTFVIWGALHGVYLIIERIFQVKTKGKTKANVPKFLGRTYVFILVTIAWVFFRAQNVHQSFYIVKNLFAGVPRQIVEIIHNQHFARLNLLYIGQSLNELVIALAGVGVLIMVQYAQGGRDIDEWVSQKPAYARWSFYYGVALAFVCLGVFSRSEFIYFQF
jgi:D-alanyl-lipoteichoic acid acyltransferase DltB (MBOAT superfamily)